MEEPPGAQAAAKADAWPKFKFDLVRIGSMLPSVIKPELKLTFRQKMMWTGAILLLFFLLGSITVWGVDSAAVARFDFLEIVFGSKFGSIITLGIGPIVTSSIILQLLVGGKILNWDTKTPEGKAKFMSTQKILAIAFSFFEAAAYVLAGAVPPFAGGGSTLIAVVILQLAAGGILIIFMDEVVSKWGIGSGVSLFIAAGVAKTIIVRIFNPLTAAGGLPSAEEPASGLLLGMITYFAAGQPGQAFITMFPLLAMISVFIIVLFAQAMRIDIPMAITMPFGKFGTKRWPLKFIYTSNIPVILVAAVLANVQVLIRTLADRGMTFLGTYDQQGQPLSGLAMFLNVPSSTSLMVVSVIAGLVVLAAALFITKHAKDWASGYMTASTSAGTPPAWKRFLCSNIFSIIIIVSAVAGLLLGTALLAVLGMPAITSLDWARAASYMLIMVIGSVIFSIFWTQTSGMDAHSVAEQFKVSFLSLPGRRHDPRIIEDVLERYIPAITVLGGAFIGFLAGFADLTNAIGSGTGILLTVMIVHQFYEQIMQQHSSELPQWLQKWIGIS